MRYTSLLFAGFLGVALTACSSTIDRRIDPDAPDAVGGAGLDSVDIESMGGSMAKAIIASGAMASATPENRTAFYITRLRNDSDQPMDTELILTVIRTQLFKGMGGRVDILDRSKESYEEVMQEREAKRSGAVTQNTSRTADVQGADLLLKGTIKNQTKQSSDLQSKYFVVTFELTDLESMRLVWMDDYRVKFESEKSVIYR